MAYQPNINNGPFWDFVRSMSAGQPNGQDQAQGEGVDRAPGDTNANNPWTNGFQMPFHPANPANFHGNHYGPPPHEGEGWGWGGHGRRGGRHGGPRGHRHSHHDDEADMAAENHGEGAGPDPFGPAFPFGFGPFGPQGGRRGHHGRHGRGAGQDWDWVNEAEVDDETLRASTEEVDNEKKDKSNEAVDTTETENEKENDKCKDKDGEKSGDDSGREKRRCPRFGRRGGPHGGPRFHGRHGPGPHAHPHGHGSHYGPHPGPPGFDFRRGGRGRHSHGPGMFGGHRGPHPPPPPPPFAPAGPNANSPFDFSTLMANLAEHPMAAAFLPPQVLSQMRNAATTSNENENENDITTFTPPLDIFSTPDTYTIHISLPGAKKDDIGVNYDSATGTLNIAGVVYRPGDEEFLQTLSQAERRVGVFDRSVVLEGREEGVSVDEEGVVARLEDGVLVVVLKKIFKGEEEEGAVGRKVEIL